MGSLACPLCCGRSFANRRTLRTHLLSTKTIIICCPECTQQFNTVAELTDHLDVDTCEQLAFVIDVNNTPDPNAKLEAYSNDAFFETLRSVQPSKLSHHSVEKSHQNENLSLPPIEQEEVVSEPQEDGKDGTIPLDPSTNCGGGSFGPLEASHHMDAIKKWEEEVPAELAEHYCNSCNCKIYGVAAHISQFHPDETVILQNAEGDEDYTASDACHPHISELNTEEGSVDDVALKYLDKTQAVDDYVCVTLLSEEEDNSVGSAYADEDSLGSHVITTKSVDNTTVSNHWSAATIDLVKSSNPTSLSGSVLDSISRKVVDVKAGGRRRKVLPTEKTSSGKSNRKGIAPTESDTDVICPYDSEGEQTKQRTEKQALSKSDASPKKKKRDTAEPVTSVPPKLKKPTLIQAHITQLMTSKTLDILKQSLSESTSNPASNEDVLQKLFTAANEYLGESGSGNGDQIRSSSSSSLPSKVDIANRSIILKFEVDGSNPLSKNTVPIFVCNMCNVEFSNPHNFAAHKCKFPKPVLPKICELCGIKFKKHYDLKMHLDTHDPTFKTRKLFQKQVKKLLSEPATCDICKTEFTSARGLKAHMRMHRPDNVKKVAEMNNKVEYRCEICNDVVYSSRAMRTHRKIHENNQQEARPKQQPRLGSAHSSRKLDLLTCKLCKESFSSNLELKSHWETHCLVVGGKLPDVTGEQTVVQMEADKELFTCNTCGMKLAESLRLDHEKTHTGEMPFVCKDCNHPFPSEMDLTFHMQAHSTTLELACVTCKTKFVDAALLKIHMRTHAGVDHPYPCGFCGRYFSRPHEKVKHERIHTGEKPYSCSTCGMRFRVSYLLRVHERIHSGIRPYVCEHCGKTFRTGSNHLRHIRIHSNVFAYPCPYCPKQFKTGVQLASHKKSHTKPYSCPHCVRHFASIYALRKHVGTHSRTSGQHTCNICGATYARSYALNEHLKTHEKEIIQEEVETEEVEYENDVYSSN